MSQSARPLDGLGLYREYFDLTAQKALVDALRSAIAEAPLFTPTMPRTGAPFSVRMSNLGALGWVSDRTGYRYQPDHPLTARPWPPIPDMLIQLWLQLADYPALPEACLVNWYEPGARMGLHRDADEAAGDAPVISISLGDDATFRIGGVTRKEPTSSLRLRSGDVVVMAGAARHAYHGIDRIHPNTGTLLDVAGRINLTLRRVTLPPIADARAGLSRPSR